MAGLKQMSPSRNLDADVVCVVILHQDFRLEYNWLTLVTCENFSAKAENYLSRRVVRAVLVSVLTDQ